MELLVSKESEVSLREQLCAQLVFLVVTRKLKPGDRLPSLGAIARRLKIHKNTVSQAYQDLAAYGLVISRRGSRLEVRSPETPLQTNTVRDLDDLINETIQAAREQGYTLQQLRERVSARLLDGPPDHILVLHIGAGIAGIAEVLRAELEDVLDCPVRTATPPETAADPSMLAGALVLCGPGTLPAVLSSVPKNQPAMPIVYCEPHQHLELVRRLEKPSLIAIVSVSQYFLDMARGVLAPIAARRHSIREYLISNGEICHTGTADLTFCDCITHRDLESRGKKRLVVPYRLISAECIEQIRARIAGT